MTECVSEAALVAYLDGRLPADESEHLLRHTDSCQSCFALLTEAARSHLSPSPTSEAPSDVHGEWQPPPVVDEYRLVGPIGRGAAGQVYLALDTQLERPVALKFLAVDAQASTRERFRLEARAVARLSHPNVVTLYRVGEVANRPFLVSEFVRGRNLQHVAKPMPWREVLAIGLQLARGVAAAHRAGVLHRDIKPANIIVADDGVVTVLDFGLAKLMESGGQSVAHLTSASVSAIASANGSVSAALDVSPSLTATGALLGTPLYMAPEAWRAEPSTAQMDVYSLGAVLYELCVGSPPHTGASVQEIRRKVLAEDVAVAGHQIPPAFAAIIERCLLREPTARFASAIELGDALEELHARDGMPARVPRPPRRRWWAATLAVLAVALAGLSVKMVVKSSGARSKRTVALKCSAEGWCWDSSWTGRQEGVWGSARDDVWHVGERGAIFHWDGVEWRRVESGTVADLYGVHGSRRDDVWATGDWGTILHWDGNSWSQRASGSGTLLADVWSFAPGDAWTVGLDGSTLHWNGVAWRAVPSGTVNGLYRLAATAPDDLWAVGKGGTILHWDGKRWTTSLETGPSQEVLMGIKCIARNDVWAVGRFDAARILHWDGVRWSRVPDPDIIPADEKKDYWFSAVWGTGPHDVWLVPKHRQCLLHWDGRKWARFDVDALGELYRLWGSGKDDIWATGDLIAVHWDGHKWRPPKPEPPYVGYQAVWASSPENVWVAGWGTGPTRDDAYAVAARWDGEQLNPIPVPGINTISALWGSGSDDVWAAGGHGAILRYDGHAFVSIPSGTQELLRGLWGSGRDDVWSVGDRGTIVHWQGATWSTVPSGTQAALYGVWGTGPSNIWSVGDHGTILHWRGRAWSLVPSGTEEKLRGIWGSGQNDIWAVGNRGTILRWSGSAWTATFSDTPEHLLGVGGSGPDDIWAVSDIWQSYHSTIVHWNGKFWSALERTPREPMYAVWAFDRGNALAVGVTGSILQFRPLDR
jgi:hypothetical protein